MISTNLSFVKLCSDFFRFTSDLLKTVECVIFSSNRTQVSENVKAIVQPIIGEFMFVEVKG